MKKLSALLTAILLMLCFSVSALALEHKETYMTVEIPENFVKDITDDGTTFYYDYSGGGVRVIDIIETMGKDSLDYSSITDDELNFLEDKVTKEYFSNGSSNCFMEYPKCSRVNINSIEGVKTTFQYYDVDFGSEYFVEMYTFSCGIYDEMLMFTSFDNTNWYEDCLNSIVIGKGILEYEEVEKTTEANSNFDIAGITESIGTVLGTMAIAALIGFIIKKIK